MTDSTCEDTKAVSFGLASMAELRVQIEDNAHILFANKLRASGLLNISIAAETTEHRPGRFRAILSFERYSGFGRKKPQFLAMSAWADSGDAALQALLSQLAMELNQRLGKVLSKLPDEEQRNGAEGVTIDGESFSACRASSHDADDIYDRPGIPLQGISRLLDDYEGHITCQDDLIHRMENLIHRANDLLDMRDSHRRGHPSDRRSRQPPIVDYDDRRDILTVDLR